MIAAAGGTHGALLDHAYCGHAAATTAGGGKGQPGENCPMDDQARAGGRRRSGRLLGYRTEEPVRA
jgi:hypothetical protein